MVPRVDHRPDEERPLLTHDNDGNDHDHSRNNSTGADDTEPREVKFAPDDPENPKAWTARKKLTNVGIIALMAILSPLASSMFTPGIKQIAEDLGVDEASIIATTTGFVISLGIGPLILAPFSETFGRRVVYVSCFAIFTLLQVPTALSPDAGTLIFLRTIAGLFGSVGIANGGGTINDMYEPRERAGIFGWYLLGPLLGPSLGPLFGGVIVSRLGWRWIYWILTIICALNTTIGYLFLKESYTPVLLHRRRKKLEEETGHKHYYEDQDDRPVLTKLRHSMKRPIVIFVQPIVFVMAMYQALIFGTTYSIFTNMQAIFSEMPYFFNSEQIGLLYLFPGLGFLVSVWFLVPRIDTVFNKLTDANNGKSMPEYRLPLANIGGVLLPVSLFWFAWTVEYRCHWAVCMAATFFYGLGQVVIFNTVQNYYIDSFSKYAASAIAGGSVFRSILGGVVPLFAPTMFEKLGYGWGISIFAFLSIAIAPSPILFYYYGPRLREKYPLRL